MNVWVTVIGDREVSAVLKFHWDPLVRFFCFCFPVKAKCFVFQLAQQLAQSGTIIDQPLYPMILTNRVRGPYCKLRPEFFPFDLGPKREARGS